MAHFQLGVPAVGSAPGPLCQELDCRGVEDCTEAESARRFMGSRMAVRWQESSRPGMAAASIYTLEA